MQTELRGFRAKTLGQEVSEQTEVLFVSFRWWKIQWFCVFLIALPTLATFYHHLLLIRNLNYSYIPKVTHHLISSVLSLFEMVRLLVDVYVCM